MEGATAVDNLIVGSGATRASGKGRDRYSVPVIFRDFGMTVPGGRPHPPALRAGPSLSRSAGEGLGVLASR
jgi:hypothetical protein